MTVAVMIPSEDCDACMERSKEYRTSDVNVNSRKINIDIDVDVI